MSQKLDGVFEGGGVKGIALIGAASVVEEHGYVWENLAGTSAGAIVATLLAAGYSAADLHPILNNIDFKKFEDTSTIGGIPVLGPQYEIFRHLGLYRGDYFLNLMRDLLAAKGKRTFRDLIVPDAPDPRYRFKVQVIASDISRGQMLILPGDIRAYGIEPEDLEIALAVRMSMSIPYFFQPIPLKTTLGETCYIVDGGLLSNFPVELFDVPGVPEWPTFGFCLVPPQTDPNADLRVQYTINGPLTMLWAMFNTAMVAHDAHYNEQPSVASRTIKIDNLGISPIAFDLSQAQKDALYASGRAGAQAFLDHWNFDAYIAQFRSGQQPQTKRQAALAQPSAIMPRSRG